MKERLSKKDREWQTNNLYLWHWGSVWKYDVAHFRDGSVMYCPTCKSVCLAHFYGVNGVMVMEIRCKKNDHEITDVLYRQKKYPCRHSNLRRRRSPGRRRMGPWRNRRRRRRCYTCKKICRRIRPRSRQSIRRRRG